MITLSGLDIAMMKTGLERQHDVHKELAKIEVVPERIMTRRQINEYHESSAKRCLELIEILTNISHKGEATIEISF